MNAVAITALFIAAAIIVSLAILGGVTLLARIEHHFAIRARLKSIGPFDPSNDVSGDVAHLPSGFHSSVDNSGAQQSAE